MKLQGSEVQNHETLQSQIGKIAENRLPLSGLEIFHGRQNNGVLGRSTGCITLDPVENNELITRLQDGALVYVTVGDAPIEKYL
jgi:hypothetical protein